MPSQRHAGIIFINVLCSIDDVGKERIPQGHVLEIERAMSGYTVPKGTCGGRWYDRYDLDRVHILG